MMLQAILTQELAQQLALSFTSNLKTDPTTDKKVTGSIKSLTEQVKTSFTTSVGIVTSRLNYLRQKIGLAIILQTII